jgi:hypothetical protein
VKPNEPLGSDRVMTLGNIFEFTPKLLFDFRPMLIMARSAERIAPFSYSAARCALSMLMVSLTYHRMQSGLIILIGIQYWGYRRWSSLVVDFS